MAEHIDPRDMTEEERNRSEGMDALAQSMLRAGMEAVVGLNTSNGMGVFAVADGIPLLGVVRILRETADLIEQEQIELIGQATVEVEEP